MNYNFPIAFFDAPEIINAAVTPIPGASSPPMQVIADSGARSAVAIDYMDTCGEFLGVYIGQPGEERLACIIGNGINGRSYAVFAAHSRVSIRSMKVAPVTFGTIVGTLMSY